MKKYGSLVPLSEKDVLGRLKDVFNEDFSNRYVSDVKVKPVVTAKNDFSLKRKEIIIR